MTFIDTTSELYFIATTRVSPTLLTIRSFIRISNISKLIIILFLIIFERVFDIFLRLDQYIKLLIFLRNLTSIYGCFTSSPNTIWFTCYPLEFEVALKVIIVNLLIQFLQLISFPCIYYLVSVYRFKYKFTYYISIHVYKISM